MADDKEVEFRTVLSSSQTINRSLKEIEIQLDWLADHAKGELKSELTMLSAGIWQAREDFEDYLYDSAQDTSESTQAPS